ncbi:MAG: ribosome silencing factor [Chloroflexi bacterium]|nr:ribosome silencing factor [Chloroflexota bacterium]
MARARMLVDVLVDRQAEDVVLLDLSNLAAFADYFVIATVDNIRQGRAVVDAVDAAVSADGGDVKAEGSGEDGWILIDCGAGVIVHLFSLEMRAYYNLEGLWSRAQEVVRIQ